jgi:hypothetical protein
MSCFRVLSLSARCIVTARPRPRDCVRLVALAMLASVAMREESPATRMWLGQMRGAFRRAVAARNAAETILQPAPWLDMLSGHALATAAVLGVVAALATFFAATAAQG